MSEQQWWEQVEPIIYKSDKEFSAETDQFLELLRDTSIRTYFLIK